MAVNHANFWGHYGKGKGHPRQLLRGRRKFQALVPVDQINLMDWDFCKNRVNYGFIHNFSY